MMLWVRKMNNIRNRATEIVNEQGFIDEKKAQLTEENPVGCALIFVCEVVMHNLSKQTNYGRVVQISCFRFVVNKRCVRIATLSNPSLGTP